MEHGRAINGVVFDIGIQTSEALNAYLAGRFPENCGFLRPEGKGNGALMRVLPLSLWHQGTDSDLVLDAHNQCLITHGHPCNQICCALYCLTARYLMKGEKFIAARENAIHSLKAIYSKATEYKQILEWEVYPEGAWKGNGTGYVVDCLRSAFMIMENAASYEEAVKRAIMLGNDTDTTACVTGGLAGILFGYENIPERWREVLKGKAEVEQLLQRASKKGF